MSANNENEDISKVSSLNFLIAMNITDMTVITTETPNSKNIVVNVVEKSDIPPRVSLHKVSWSAAIWSDSLLSNVSPK